MLANINFNNWNHPSTWEQLSSNRDTCFEILKQLPLEDLLKFDICAKRNRNLTGRCYAIFSKEEKIERVRKDWVGEKNEKQNYLWGKLLKTAGKSSTDIAEFVGKINETNELRKDALFLYACAYVKYRQYDFSAAFNHSQDPADSLAYRLIVFVLKVFEPSIYPLALATKIRINIYPNYAEAYQLYKEAYKWCLNDINSNAGLDDKTSKDPLFLPSIILPPNENIQQGFYEVTARHLANHNNLYLLAEILYNDFLSLRWSPKTAIKLARIKFKLGKYKEAGEIYKKDLKQLKNQEGAYEAIECYMKLGWNEAIVQTYKEISDYYGEGIDRKLIRQMALFRMKRGEWYAAYQEYLNIFRLRESYLAEGAPLESDDYKGAFICELKLGYYEKALTYFKIAKEIFRGGSCWLNTEFERQAAYCHLKLEEFYEAITLYDKLVCDNYRNADEYNSNANEDQLFNMFDIKTDGSAGAMYAHRAFCNYKMKDFDTAEMFFDFCNDIKLDYVFLAAKLWTKYHLNKIDDIISLSKNLKNLIYSEEAPSEIFEVLALAYFKNKQYDEAGSFLCYAERWRFITNPELIEISKHPALKRSKCAIL